MTAQPLIVVEANEVSPRVLRDFARDHPASFIARMLAEGAFVETRAGDVARDFLYPSQTWASMNTGAPYERHRVHWYNDEKPAAYPHYAEILAAHGLAVGTYGSIHSAALARIGNNVAFFMPDSYDQHSAAIPPSLNELHRLDVALVRENGRTSDLASVARRLPHIALSVARHGLRASTAAYGAGQLARIATRRVTRERLRNLHFALHADVFLDLLARESPAYCAFFTNHVAANMHRYWYAAYPRDLEGDAAYDAAWIGKHRGEIGEAMRLLDEFLARVAAIARARGAALVVCTSMGQAANPALDTSAREHVVCREVAQLLARLVPGGPSFEVENAMVPQYTLRFASPEAADSFARSLRDALPGAPGIEIGIDPSGARLTLTIAIEATGGVVTIGGRAWRLDELGLASLPIDDHHSGSHCPEGSLAIFNSRTADPGSGTCDYLELAPAILRHFGVPAADYMLEPSIRL